MGSVENYRPQFLTIKLLCCKEWDSERGIIERCAYIGHHITAALCFIWILDNEQLLYFCQSSLVGRVEHSFVEYGATLGAISQVELLVQRCTKSRLYPHVYRMPRAHNPLLLAHGHRRGLDQLD